MKKPLSAATKKFLFDTFAFMISKGEELEVRRTTIRYLEAGAFDDDDIVKIIDIIGSNQPVENTDNETI